jgi:DMSO/TMAO reductase YedYZ molybdopterin-dependent catalytic subunit
MLPALLLVVLTALPAPRATDSLVVEVDGKVTVLRDADFAAFPTDSVRGNMHGGPMHTWSGWPLRAILARAGVRIDTLHAAALARRIVAEASDGYRIVLALSDLDASINPRQVIVANRQDGQALPADEGPIRLVIGGDARPARWVRQLVAIRIRSESP